MGDDTPALFEIPAAGGRSGKFEPARLTQARALCALSKADLAARVNVSPAAVGQYESGINSPRQDVIEKLADATGMRSDFFEIGRPLARMEDVNAHFRSLRSARVRDRQKALATATLVWEITFALERFVRLPEADLPNLELDTSPAEAALRLRRHWELPDGPVRHLTATAESHGVVVVTRPLADIEAVDAFSVKIVERPIIVMTPRRSANVFRHRFSIAHEIGHLLLHGDVSEPSGTIEREADEFAAAFLTPAASMDAALPSRLDLAALDRLGRTWGVSPHSLVRRMVERGRTTESSARRAYQRLASVNDPTADPTSAYPGETPSLLARAAELASDHGTPIPAIAEAVRLRPGTVRSLLGGIDQRPTLRIV